MRLLLAVAAASLCAGAQDEDWKISGVVDPVGAKFTLECKLVDTDGKLRGLCASHKHSVVAAGSIDGKVFQLAYDASIPGRSLHVAYVGIVAADGTVSGRIDAGLAHGRFTASKN